MKTNIYFVKNNAETNVIFEQGGKWFVAPENNGYNTDTNVDLYSDNAIEVLAAAYSEMEFNSFEDNYINAEFSGIDFANDVEETAESICLICTAEE